MTTTLLAPKTDAAAGIACESDSIETVPLVEERSFAYWQQDIPAHYWKLSAEELTARIDRARSSLGTRAIILGHHYQREDVVAFADYKGDSFKLARWAAEHPESEYIIFCGVHFMAEAADILSAAHQKVVLPNMAAGCSMSDMADPDDVFNAWAELEELGIAQDTLPVTYMNSAAALKAFVGAHGGAVCTSSNARKVMEWAFTQKKRVLFFPDQHLGRNTGCRHGHPARRDGALGLGASLRRHGWPDAGRRSSESRVLLWAGHCSVHQRFTPEQIADARRAHPGVIVVVHPECRSRRYRLPTSMAPQSSSRRPSPKHRPARRSRSAPRSTS